MNDQLPVGGNGSPAVEELRSRAEDARADLADSLRALRTRMSPQELLARAKTSVRDRAGQATANATTGLRRGARAIRREFVGRRQQAMGAARKRPVAAAASAVLAGVAWYVARHRNGHEREVGIPKQGNGCSARSGSVSVTGNSEGRDAEGDLAVNIWDLPAAMPAPVVRPRSTSGLWTAGAAAAFLTSVVAASRSTGDPVAGGSHERRRPNAASDAEIAREHSGRAADGTVRAGAVLRVGPAAIAGALAGIAAAMLLPRWPGEARLSTRVQQAARGALSASGRRLVDHARRSLEPTVSALLHSTPGRLPGE